MDSTPTALWVAACAHHLQRRWRTVDPAQLEALAADLAGDAHLRAMPPDDAAAQWLEPVALPAHTERRNET
ncbi:MAG: hypothetical protein DI563_22360 [Variovorax paradoxus]|uniref:Uncharacterized protein n=1 Tax=Variovorax paradoxus TaxID=34073 RepID=A0A2W5PNF0_VARPD|nr:MAG: hypothetical protein DI563_22360 [Variovorax paradoxus]